MLFYIFTEWQGCELNFHLMLKVAEYAHYNEQFIYPTHLKNLEESIC